MQVADKMLELVSQVLGSENIKNFERLKEWNIELDSYHFEVEEHFVEIWRNDRIWYCTVDNCRCYAETSLTDCLIAMKQEISNK